MTKKRRLVEIENGHVRLNPGVHGPMPVDSWHAKIHTDRTMVMLAFEMSEDVGLNELHLEHTCNACGCSEKRPVEPRCLTQYDKVFTDMLEGGWCIAPSLAAPDLHMLLCPECNYDYSQIVMRRRQHQQEVGNDKA